MVGVPLDLALRVAFVGDHRIHEPRKATGWSEGPSPQSGATRLLLYWTDQPHTIPFPAALDVAAAEVMVAAWLDNVDYPPEPDHDGHNVRSVRVYNEAWNRIGDFATFVAIEPVWLMYGK